MVDAINSTSGSPYAGLQPFGGSASVEPEVRRPPQPVLPEAPGPVAQLQEAIRNSGIDTEELAARATAVFGDDAAGLVDDTGAVDLNALSSLIAEERATNLTESLTSRYGEDAAGLVTERGEVDRDSLLAFLEERGLEEDPRPAETGFSGGTPTGYGPQGQASSTPPLNFVSVFA